jgi:hypothetical protein
VDKVARVLIPKSTPTKSCFFSVIFCSISYEKEIYQSLAILEIVNALVFVRTYATGTSNGAAAPRRAPKN